MIYMLFVILQKSLFENENCTGNGSKNTSICTSIFAKTHQKQKAIYRSRFLIIGCNSVCMALDDIRWYIHCKAHNPKVVGSNPAAATKLKSAMQLFWEMAVKTRNFVAKFMKTCQGTLYVLWQIFI